MASISRIYRWGACLLIIFVVTALKTRADGDRFAGLVANSPFGMAPAVTAAAGSKMEFRGYVYEEGALMFSLAYPETGGRIRSAWVGLGGTFSDHVVRSFDQDSNAVQVEYRGQQIILRLKMQRVQALQTAARAVVSVNPTAALPNDDRLEAVAAAIKRRRAMREANANSNDATQP